MSLKFGKINYSTTSVPKKYRCCKCKKTGCKLWRTSGVFLSNVELFCCDCAAAINNTDISLITEDGMVPWGHEYGFTNQLTDQFGGCCPAVPDPEGETYWGYSSVPNDGVNWWKRLPTRI